MFCAYGTLGITFAKSDLEYFLSSFWWHPVEAQQQFDFAIIPRVEVT